MKKVIYLFVTIFSLFIATYSHSGQAQSSHPCAADAKKFCSDVDPGQGRMRKCLKKNKKDLSPACTAKLNEAEKEMKQIMKTCKKDKKQFCSEASDKSEAFKCLEKNRQKLSSECKAEIKKTF